MRKKDLYILLICLFIIIIYIVIVFIKTRKNICKNDDPKYKKSGYICYTGQNNDIPFL